MSVPAKAFLCEIANPSKKIDFHFNPTSIKFTKTAEFKQAPRTGATHPKVEFTGTGPTDLKLDLLLDAMERQPTSDVQAKVEMLLDWTGPTSASRNTRSPSPPELQFTWGSLVIGGGTTFHGHLKSVDVSYLLFARTGEPLRAEVSLTLTSKAEDPKGTNPTSGGTRPQRAHTLVRGDTLQSVAWSTYGDPGYWRRIAEVNAVDNPLRVPIGTRLLLPDTGELEGER
jgi:hypothetical protein